MARSQDQRGGSGALGGKTVLVTGAAGGIGAALATQLAQAGAKLALCDLDSERLERLAGQLGGEVRCSTHAFDITDEAACGQAVAAAIRRWGGIDVLINNAGITHRSLFSETEPSVIRKVLEVNFLGAVYCTKAALQSIVERRGSIVATSSVAGFAPLVGRAGYSASKHAMHGFFDTLRTELSGKGVHVLLVCPSFTDTPIEQNALSGEGDRAQDAGRSIVGKMVEPEVVAKAIVQAVIRRRRQLVHSPVGKLSWWLNRLAPSLYDRAMRRSQAKTFEL